MESLNTIHVVLGILASFAALYVFSKETISVWISKLVEKYCDINKRLFKKPIPIILSDIRKGGNCKEELEGCTAKRNEGFVVTQVDLLGTQIDVCQSCLEKRIKEKTWQVC